ncbi:MAG: ABC transporter permease subunit [Acidisphaera sp.]|nr:ABC transporter permease subunit [Acidisphaera sp.]
MHRRALLTLGLLPGLLFLYLPIILLVLFSFNDARLLTGWAGFSWRWYAALWHDRALIEAALLSLQVAALAATGATLVGLAAGLALARFARFPGRAAFTAALAAPLVLPDVLIGLSLLLLFVATESAIGWPHNRGVATIVLAHVTFSLSYVAVVVQARLADTDPALEEAAADLGAPPWRVFLAVTLPLAAPALLSGWLLAFTLSLDDLVVASFVSGPGASTLPMVVFSSLHLGATPELDALATVMLAICAAALAIAGRIGVARRRRRL